MVRTGKCDSREPKVTTAPELLQRGLPDSLDQIEDLSSVSPVDPDIGVSAQETEIYVR